MKRLAQEHLDTKLGEAGDQTSNPPVTSQPTLPPEIIRPLLSDTVGTGAERRALRARHRALRARRRARRRARCRALRVRRRALRARRRARCRAFRARWRVLRARRRALWAHSG